MELKIDTILKEKGLRMADLAKKLGTNQSNLTKSLDGNPRLSTLTEVAEVLGVNVRELFPDAPVTLSAGTLQMGDKHYALVPIEAQEEPYIFSSSRFYEEAERFIVNSIKSGKTGSLCGIFRGYCPVSLIYDGDTQRLLLSFAPTDEGFYTFAYGLQKNPEFFYDEEKTREMARDVIVEFMDYIRKS